MYFLHKEFVFEVLRAETNSNDSEKVTSKKQSEFPLPWRVEFVQFSSHDFHVSERVRSQPNGERSHLVPQLLWQFLQSKCNWYQWDMLLLFVGDDSRTHGGH